MSLQATPNTPPPAHLGAVLRCPVDEPTARFLVSEAGGELLREAAMLPGDGPDQVLALRKRGLSQEIAAGAVEVMEARKRAHRRFNDAENLFFTAESLAQATSPVIAAYHAERLAPFGTVADLCCGVGMDAVPLAQAGAKVTAVDIDAARLVFARANAEARGVVDRVDFVQDDVTVMGWGSAPGAYWDPARREGGRRVSRHAENYEPPLSFLETLRATVRGGCVKLSPALPDDVLDNLGGRVEFLSEERQCKEACLWFGEAVGVAGDRSRAAVLLPERLVVAPSEENPLPRADALGKFIHDPDPAIVRAGALGTLAGWLGAKPVSADDAYLTSDAPGKRRLVSSYRVREALVYRPAELRKALRAHGIGRLVVKKRHFPKEPDAVARELGLSGTDAEATLILVRAGGGHTAVLCEPAAGSE